VNAFRLSLTNWYHCCDSGQRKRRDSQRYYIRGSVQTREKIKKISRDDFSAGVSQKPLYFLQPKLSRDIECGKEDVLL